MGAYRQLGGIILSNGSLYHYVVVTYRYDPHNEYIPTLQDGNAPYEMTALPLFCSIEWSD
jgi:hypothetical protein